MAAAGVDPLEHFNVFGWREGRNPNAWFDTAGYLAHYADVAAAGVNPLEHYQVFGWHEGRDPSSAFDTQRYLAANPDVDAAHVNPLEHFLLFGAYEGRAASMAAGYDALRRRWDDDGARQALARRAARAARTAHPVGCDAEGSGDGSIRDRFDRPLRSSRPDAPAARRGA